MDAESDHKYLKECFFETGDLMVLQDCSEPKRIVVGRVGAGKSALLGRVLEQSTNAIEIKAEELSLNWISNSDIIQFFENAGVKLDLFYQLLWKHVFVVELLKSVIGLQKEIREAFWRIFMIYLKETLRSSERYSIWNSGVTSSGLIQSCESRSSQQNLKRNCHHLLI
jgi:hypothetical protein